MSLRIGVVGLGFGLQHVRTLANLAEATLVAVADRNNDQIDAVAQKYGATGYRDALEMIEKEPLDGLSICTAPHTRNVLIQAAAAKKLPMLIEKPWAASVAQGKELEALCGDTLVMPAFSFRFHPVVTRLRALMDGDLGAGWLLNGQYLFGWNPPADGWLWKPESGGGFFNENSCHLLDVLCYLLGQPVSVQAEATNPQNSPSENAAALTIAFEKGAIAAVTLGGVGAGAWKETGRIDLVTQNGQARLSAREHVWERLRWTTRGDSSLHEMTQTPEALGETRYSHGFRHFFHSIKTGEPPAATIADGLRCVALAEAIYQSAREGRKVSLSL
jgi:predicted dehydrogenase